MEADSLADAVHLVPELVDGGVLAQLEVLDLLPGELAVAVPVDCVEQGLGLLLLRWVRAGVPRTSSRADRLMT